MIQSRSLNNAVTAKGQKLKLYIETDKPDAEIARDLRVQQTTLSTWKQKYLKNQKQAFAGTNGFDSLSKEIKALKKELALAKQERDILKKALAICNSQPETYMP